jgi:hypothetical protein
MIDWAARRSRAEVLREQYPFAVEALTLYLALVEVWAGTDPPATDLTRWATRTMVPSIAEATAQAGPAPLAKAVDAAVAGGGLEHAMAAWLAGADLPPVERFLARASLHAALPVVDAGLACAADPAPRGGRRCPRCGGLPQVSFRSPGGDALVSGQRNLQCARCAAVWGYSRSACPFCGEAAGASRTVYAEEPTTRHGPVVGPATEEPGPAATFPHLSLDACTQCRRYIIDVDTGRDGRAVPEVDELAALPLDLYAADHGLTKITANLMGW